MKKANAKAPGKLFIAGEYAVVEAGQPAVIVAVDRFITVNVSPVSTNCGTIHSDVLSNRPIKWKRTEHGLEFSPPSDNLAIIRAAMETAETYLSELGKPFGYYNVTVESDLVNEGGLKYGLGSSGAVTVAFIEALMKANSINLPNLKLYKLASLAHLSLGSHGSFGDLAAACFTGWLAYRRFDQDSLNQLREMHSTKEIVEQPWDRLSIEALPAPESLTFLVGWTGTPASTESLVKQSRQSAEQLSHSQFLENSNQCVSRLIKALKKQDTKEIMREISVNRDILLEMAEAKSLTWETPLLNKLYSIASDHFAAAKTSGAGGGDCGIALIPEAFDASLLTADWQRAGIVPLDLSVYTK